MQHAGVPDPPPTGPGLRALPPSPPGSAAAAVPTVPNGSAGSGSAAQTLKDIPPQDGRATPPALAVRAGGSLSDTLRGRELVAQTSAVLAEVLQAGVDQAEALLISEARRRGVPTPTLAQEALQHPEEATQWRLARCSVCGAAGLLRVFGDYQLLRVLVCPEGHGVICRG